LTAPNEATVDVLEWIDRASAVSSTPPTTPAGTSSSNSSAWTTWAHVRAIS
jgi:hypothetical protein